MQWTKETEEIVATLPLPPVLSSYDRLKCDRLARKQRCFPIHKRTWYRALAITLAIGLILGLGCNDNPDEPPTVIISDQGGTYVTPEGIILEVPAGAVSEPTRVYVVMMDKSSTQTPLNENGLLRREFIAGVTLTTEVNPLQKSIWVTLPIDYSPVFTSIPLHYVYD